jgi:hypothetical protein
MEINIKGNLKIIKNLEKEYYSIKVGNKFKKYGKFLNLLNINVFL